MVNLSDLKKLANNLSILYVEDEQELRDTMEHYLKKLFSTLVTCTNGLEGLEAYQHGIFDVVITDLQMPHMGGIEMIEKIKAINPSQEILITSAYAETSYFMSCIKAGVSGYIIKPIDFEQFNFELYKVLSRLFIIKENEAYHTQLEMLVDNRTKEIIELSEKQMENYKKTLLAMVELVEDRDTYTGGHSQRVAQYCVAIAQKMGYSSKECDLLYQAGILHDIGKISTPDSILLKPGTLNDVEYKLIQEHVTVGYQVLQKVPMFHELANIIYAHHERYDGTGYPRGLKKEEICKLSHIMIVADAFDAMTTNRIYKGRKNVKQALEEIHSLSGKQFDPEVVEVAMSALVDIDVKDHITQLPQTDLEQERFSYFFRDALTDSFNSHYLDFILVRNHFEKSYGYLYGFFLTNFSQYNKNKGWHAGDTLLMQFSKYLTGCFPNAMIFRFHGDDFILITQEKLPQIDLFIQDSPILRGTDIGCKTVVLDLLTTPITSLKNLESFFR